MEVKEVTRRGWTYLAFGTFISKLMALKFDQQLAVQQSNIFVLSSRKFISCCFSDDCARINNSLAHNSEELDYIDWCLFIILPVKELTTISVF